jgi:hypothetical protein
MANGLRPQPGTLGLTRRTARAPRAGTWLPVGTAVAQWILVGCALLASGAYTLGYLARVPGPGRRLDELGRFTQAAELTGALASFTAYLAVVPVTWWLIGASLRRVGAQPDVGRPHRRAIWQRIWLLALAIVGPPLLGAILGGERPLTVAPLWMLAEVPLAALALWALGAYLLLGYWMRRVCLRVGLAGLAMHLLVRRVKLLPAWMVEWPQTGGALGLTEPEAQYLSFFTLSVMAFGFVVLGSMMVAARPPVAPGPVILTPPPVPPLPGPIPPTPVERVEPAVSATLPTHLRVPAHRDHSDRRIVITRIGRS